MEKLLSVLLSVPSLLLGGALGLLSGLILHRKQSQRAISAILFQKYMEIRDQLADILSDVASLSLVPEQEHLDAQTHIERLSKCFYKYYDLIPQSVLMELNCLHSCLRKEGQFAYVVVGSTEIRKLDYHNTREVGEFLKHVSLVVNDIAPITEFLARGGGRKRRRLILNLQARKALQCMNDHFTFSDITSWQTKLKKFTVYERGDSAK